ncbi:hypothetical protein H5410_043874 [Solanum commersonii]|uniref:Uncharacterized protein n=1 Tax=Solanum commersonii TaxID=4109 RepID=A0A9J5Y1G4_SOLCO|nr:hypothetical protein H5410_043874 [Solanum commersonii]
MKTFSLAIDENSHKKFVLNRVIQIIESEIFLILSPLHLFVYSLPLLIFLLVNLEQMETQNPCCLFSDFFHQEFWICGGF